DVGRTNYIQHGEPVRHWIYSNLRNGWSNRGYARICSCGLSVPRYLFCCSAFPLRYRRGTCSRIVLWPALLVAENVWSGIERNAWKNRILDVYYRVPLDLLPAAFPRLGRNAAPRIHLLA